MDKSHKHNVEKISIIIEDYIWYDVTFIHILVKIYKTIFVG